MSSTLRVLTPKPAPNALLDYYLQVRRRTETLITPLEPEDMVVQSMPDASPSKWHIAHTSWFFETFLLSPQLKGYKIFDDTFCYLFNSYYEAVGPRHPRPHRGLLTRPAISEVIAYRKHVDRQMSVLLQTPLDDATRQLVELGLAHEEQHQELLLMDILHLFNTSPLKPAYNPQWPEPTRAGPGRFKQHIGGLLDIGHTDDAFAFDNESPRHTTYLQPFEISDRLVTNGEWLAFIADGGYQQVDLWLSEGWDCVQSQGWKAPLYWHHDEHGWSQMTLRGMQPINPDDAVTHISYHEATAFACWVNARLPTEAEWEVAAQAGMLQQVDDVAWQWTQSHYSAYPGFNPAPGAVGEYNGKFMINQMVLRGGSAFSSPGHTRLSYRNFFHADKRWMLSGLRLARDIQPHQQHTKSDNEFLRDVQQGLSAKPKALSPKYFYDAKGSALFEAICKTPEYYPTRAETRLLSEIADEISATIASGSALIEFGSGASEKTCLVLDATPQLGAYVPIDICPDALEHATQRLNKRYPELPVIAQTGDFTEPVELPEQVAAMAKVGFFPGSTIGNFTRSQAIEFLKSAKRLLGANGQFIVGVDMVKDRHILEAAYDDAGGVTAAFNKNLLTRINRELGANFCLENFAHVALWNPEHQRMEMHLQSLIDQCVEIAGQRYIFSKNERLHTECSHKFTLESFSAMAAEAGWIVSQHWISAEPEVGLMRLTQQP
ncbi:Dimethylhistidine N-methyltransferase [Pseudomonas marincola]|uniref:Dimethylhistidine N-methyltransferase n=1 Tax=Pseudomonas marincola TaxID=437900 RepID=A0A653E3L8_9PSED|nr:ergothioneine biosynthesis protein EgtB [Pseudomonas marincola]CAE6887657.1 Dimethylhistidine N-methyltransferase [Pseudomonas marincola]